MQLEGIHHITAITGDAPRNLDFYTRVLGLRLAAKTVNQDDPSVYHLFYADELRPPGSDLTFFEYPGAPPRPRRRRDGPPIVLARRGRRGARLLGSSASATRASRPSATDAPALRRPRGPRARARRQRDRRRAAVAPSTPRSRPSTRCRASTASAPTRLDPERSGALLERLLGAERAGDGRLGAARRAPRRRRSPTTPRRPSAGARARARSTTSPGARPSPSTRRWHERIARRRRAGHAGHRPPLLPLDLLPRAERRALRDRRRRPRLHRSTCRSRSSARR